MSLCVPNTAEVHKSQCHVLCVISLYCCLSISGYENWDRMIFKALLEEFKEWNKLFDKRYHSDFGDSLVSGKIVVGVFCG